MYKKLNNVKITENHLRMLALFTKGFNKEYYIRETHKLLGLSPRAAQLILADLERRGAIESQIRGKIRSYRIRKNIMAREYLALAEEYKKIFFLENNELLREVVGKLSEHAEGIITVFGSFAKGNQKEDSDLDVLIAGKCDKDAIAALSKQYGVSINVKNYPQSTFEQCIKSDVLLREVAENHIILAGIEGFLKAAM